MYWPVFIRPCLTNVCNELIAMELNSVKCQRRQSNKIIKKTYRFSIHTRGSGRSLLGGRQRKRSRTSVIAKITPYLIYGWHPNWTSSAFRGVQQVSHHWSSLSGLSVTTSRSVWSRRSSRSLESITETRKYVRNQTYEETAGEQHKLGAKLIAQSEKKAFLHVAGCLHSLDITTYSVALGSNRAWVASRSLWSLYTNRKAFIILKSDLSCMIMKPNNNVLP